jgi:hypothetical protein
MEEQGEIECKGERIFIVFANEKGNKVLIADRLELK